MRALSSIHPHPDNPRLIRDREYAQLQASIKASPWMLELRPILVDEDGLILAGRQRYQALLDEGRTEAPDEWIRTARGLSVDQKRELMIKDNAHAGEFDWTVSPDVWQAVDFDGWGVTPEWDTGEPKRSVTRKRHTDDGLEAFEILLPADDRKRIKAQLARIKKQQSLATLAEAFIHVFSSYPKK